MTNLITNPGAETGTMSNWTDSGATITAGWITVQGGCERTGNWAFGTAAPSAATGVMSQDLTLEIGAMYTLTIWVKNYMGGPCSLACSIGGVTLISVPIASPTYIQYSSDFIANSLTETLQISGSAAYMICTDDISVTFLLGSPSAIPTLVPTDQLSELPTPTLLATASPSSRPSVQPTYFPTSLPSSRPTNAITSVPTAESTLEPSVKPSKLSSVNPTKKPTLKPTLKPSIYKYSEDIMTITNVDLGNLKDGKQITIAGANFDTAGFSVNGVGDINYDGISDIVIGAPGCNNIASTTCRSIDPRGGGISYVVYGELGRSPSIINLESISLQKGFAIIGNATSNSGYSVSGTGDINKDGYNDIIVGEPGNPNYPGKVYVIFGRHGNFPDNIYLDSFSLSQGFTIYGENNGDRTGYSISGAGDINKDAYKDIIIGAPGSGASAGKTYVIFGNNFTQNIHLSNLTMPQGFTIYGANLGDNSGWSVSGAGDVNGDKYDDFIIGVPKSSSYHGIYTGITYVIFGNETNTFTDIYLNSTINGFTITGSAADAWSGFSVSSAGDFDKNGIDDIIIGAPAVNTGEGISYVIFGNESPENIDLAKENGRWVSMSGASIFDYSGTSVSGAGDVNGDGIGDIIIGAPGATDGGTSYVVFGSKNPKSLKLEILSNDVKYNPPGFSIVGANYADRSGYSVGNASDFNGDGYSDVIVGAPGAGGIAWHNGLSYIVYGGKMPPEDPKPSWWTTTPEGIASMAGIIIYGLLFLSTPISNIYISFARYRKELPDFVQPNEAEDTADLLLKTDSCYKLISPFLFHSISQTCSAISDACSFSLKNPLKSCQNAITFPLWFTVKHTVINPAYMIMWSLGMKGYIDDLDDDVGFLNTFRLTAEKFVTKQNEHFNPKIVTHSTTINKLFEKIYESGSDSALSGENSQLTNFEID